MTSKPRVLMFAPAFAPEFFSEALVNSKLALAMVDAGWDLTVFTASTEGSYSQTWTEPWLGLRRIANEIEPTRLSGFQRYAASLNAFVRCPHPVPGLLWAYEAANKVSKLHAQLPFDLIITRSTSCVAHLPAMMLRQRLGIPWMANWNDPPSHRFPAPYPQPQKSPSLLIKDRYLRAAASLADVNSFPSAYLRGYLSHYLGLKTGDRSIILPHIGLVGKRNTPSSAASIFRVTHAGNLSAPRDPNLFLQVFRRLIDRHPETSIELEIIGGLSPDYQRLIEKHQLNKHVHLIDGLSYIDCQDRLGKASVLLVIEAACTTGIFLPSKLIDYAEAGPAILALSPREGTLQQLNIEMGFGKVVDCASLTEIDQALESLFLARHNDVQSQNAERFIEYSSPENVLGRIESEWIKLAD